MLFKRPMSSSKTNFSKKVLIVAAIYNALWGALVLLTPTSLFLIIGMNPPQELIYWQCIGMFVGVFAIGYFITAFHPERYWPMIFVGLLGKIAGVTGFILNYCLGSIDFGFFWLVLFNDILWIPPFTLILCWIAKAHFVFNDLEPSLSPTEASRLLTLSNGKTLFEFSSEKPLRLIFLRHAGCTFCREMLADISRLYANPTDREDLIIVHMDSEEEINTLLLRFDIKDIVTCRDSKRILYRIAGLKRGSFKQLFGLRELSRGIMGLLRGYGVSLSSGDPFQLGGLATMKNGELMKVQSFYRASDVPVAMCEECTLNT